VIVAFTNSKGGVGKSTLSVHLAAWLKEQGRNVLLVDADVQASSSVWLKETSPEARIIRLQTADDILDQIPKVRLEVDDIVIDGPAGLSEVTRSILFVADYTLLPCTPSVVDLRPANESIRVVRQAQQIRKGPPEAIFVPNRLRARQKLSKDLVDTARQLGVRVSSGLKHLNAYADAAGQGTVVWRLGLRAQDAANEIRSLFMELFANELAAAKTLNERSVANG
jgi:chromosome partitioning protein